MKHWKILIALLAFTSGAHAQDIGWMLERVPVVSMVLAKSFERFPSFSARAEVKLSGKADPIPSGASGTIECGAGNLRWDVKLRDINSAQLSESARALLKRANGENLMLLTRPRLAANQLVLSGARAYVEEALPKVKLAVSRAVSNESIDGHPCVRERVTVLEEDGRTLEVMLWKATDLKRLPIQLRFTDAGEVIQVRLNNVRFREISARRFQVPVGLTKHENMEDLMQWVVVDKMRRRMGL